MKMNIKPIPAILSTLALWGAITALAMLIGCATKPPTALEQRIFNITTNYYPELVIVTNTAYRTNTVVETIAVTNKVGVIVNQFETNTITVPITQVQTQVVQIPAYTYNVNTNGPGAAAQGVATTIGNIVAPGVGGPIAGAIVPLGLAIWAWIRGSKKSATANNLAQTIETARELIKSLPNGTALDNTLTTWMQNHQAEAGVLPQVLDILNSTVDNQVAKQTADQLKAALAALQTPKV